MHDKPLIRPNFFVLTGGSSSGKSSIIAALEERGHICVPEAGRIVVQEENASGGDGQPWVNLGRFADLIFEKALSAFETHQHIIEPVFFDRSFIEALSCAKALTREIPQEHLDVVRSHRFNGTIFVTSPWQDIFTNDAERKTTLEAAERDYDVNIATYRESGYEPVEVPRLSVEERVQFILEQVANTTLCTDAC